MNRCALALAGLLALPVCATAQAAGTYTAEPHPQQLPHTRFAVTPFVGARMPFSTGAFFVTTESGDQFRVEQEREGSLAVGLNGEYRFNRSLGVVGGVAFSGAAQDISTSTTPAGADDEFQIDGPSFWFAKAGVSWRLPDPVRDTRRFHPSAMVSVAPALVVTSYSDVPGFPELSGNSTHFAVNLAADAVTRLGGGKWALSVGLEDYITFWNDDKLAEREAFIWAAQTSENVAVDFDYAASNILLLRLGVSYRP